MWVANRAKSASLPVCSAVRRGISARPYRAAFALPHWCRASAHSATAYTSALWRQRRGDEIEPGSAPWLAAQKPRQRHPAAGPQAVPLDRLIGIIRAGRQMPAMESDKRR